MNNFTKFDFSAKPKMHDFKNYWKSMGFTTLQCFRSNCANTNKKLTSEDVVRDIYNTNSEFFNNMKNIEAKLPITCIDGTCCTGKTTICNNFKYIKTKKLFDNVAMNSSPLGSMGYYYTSIRLLKEFVEANKNDKILISDRTPFNNYQWNLMWQMIGLKSHPKTKYIEQKTDKNAYTIINEIEDVPVYSDTLLNMWRAILSNMSDVVMDDFMKIGKIVYIVDSNESNVRKRMRHRNEGSDAERANWNTYISIQNFAYAYFAEKYPKNICFIDISAYSGGMEFRDVVKSIIFMIQQHFSCPDIEYKLPIFEPYQARVPCLKYTKKYREHERKRAFNMDKFYSKLKVDYKEFVEKKE